MEQLRSTTSSINGITGDNDWYKFQIAAAGRVTINLTPLDSNTTVGNEGGPAPTPVDSQRYVNLQLELVRSRWHGIGQCQ